MRHLLTLGLGGGLVLWSLLGAGCGPEEPEPDTRPNFLFLLADDQRANTISAHGNPSIETPHLDRLAFQGFSFRSNYCLGSNSGAVCVPSRAMIHSGLAYHRVSNDLEGIQTLPEILREQGYVTFATGKWHNGQPSFLRSFSQAKKVFFGGMADHMRVPIEDLGGDGALHNKRSGEMFSSQLFADAAVGFLKSHTKDKPFYAYVAFTAPHDPRQPPESFRDHYYEARPPLPGNFRPQHPFDNGWLVVRDEELAAWPRTPEVISDQLAEYYGLITHLDEQIGRILEALEASGQAENTYIVYAADHGLALGSHGLLGKQSLYEHSMRAPLIIAGPGIPRGGSSECLTYLFDIFPTILSLAGGPLPAPIDGRDLAPIWKGESDSVREALFLSFADSMRAVRRDSWKLIVYPQVNHLQLFNLEEDPDEILNRADDPGQADRVARMTVLLEEWQEHLGDDQALSSEDPGPLEIDLTGRERQPDRWQPDWIVEKYFDALNPPEPDSPEPDTPEPDSPEPTISSDESNN